MKRTGLKNRQVTVTALPSDNKRAPYRLLWLYSTFNSATFTLDLLSQGWIVLDLTGSPFWVGVAAATRGITQSLLSIFGGAIADRLEKRRVLVAAHLLAALGAAAIFLLLISRTTRLWHIMIYMALLGLLGATNRPAFGALIYDHVGTQRLLNVNASYLMGSSLVRIAAALAGGYVLDTLGVSGNYFIIVVAHGASLCCLTLLKGRGITRTVDSFLIAVIAGLSYAIRTPPIRRLLLLSLAVEAFGFSHLYMMPVIARDVLRVGGTGLGYLMAMWAVGQFLATLLLIQRHDIQDREDFLVRSAFGFGVFVIMFGLSRWFGASLFLATLTGAFGISYDAFMHTVLLATSSDEMRGRVFGFYSSTQGLNLLGGFGIGAIGSMIGIPFAVATGGSLVTLSALTLLFRAKAANLWPQLCDDNCICKNHQLPTRLACSCTRAMRRLRQR